MTRISSFLSLGLFAGAVALSALAAISTATPASARPQYIADTAMEVSFRDSDRVCCKRGYRDGWSTWRECRRAGGHATANTACRDDQVNFRGDQRVCCQRGRHDWWSTSHECRRNGGAATANRECRNDSDNRVFSYNDHNVGYNNYGYGNNKGYEENN